MRKQVMYLTAIFISVFVITGIIDMITEERVQEMPREVDTDYGKEEISEPIPVGANPTIRVLLLSTGYQSTAHSEVKIAVESGFRITWGQQSEVWNIGDVCTIYPDDARFAEGCIRITPIVDGEEIRLCHLERGYGVPSYGGTVELRTTPEGIVIINEITLENYLYKVVPSEMPVSYEAEALKAQAVCARSYAYRQMFAYAYPEYEAHVNDSTDFQVYNNSLTKDTAIAAVEATRGQVLYYNGQIAVTYYYSTSCGKTTNLEAWGTEVNEGNAYLQSVSVSNKEGDYEEDLPWYRWSAAIPKEVLSDLVGLNTGVDVGELISLEVTKRGAGEIALQIEATGEKGNVVVDTENKIRRALGGSGYTITKNDGTEVDSTHLLPSAFFTIERSGDTFVIDGGGFGHGIGMSQNGANEMAKKGKNYREILGLFYPGTVIESLE